MNGYVKIHRKLLDNPIVCKDSEYFAVWFYLLLNATHKNIDALFKGKRITLKPGQLLTGTISISKKMKINKDKVQRILKAFEIDKQIAQQPSNKNRLITILNWDLYQNVDKQNDKQLINNCETTDKQLITNNNDKNVKNDNNVKNIIKDIVEYLNLKTDSNYKYTSKKTHDLIKARIKEGFTVEDFKKVIDKKTKQWLRDEKMNMYLRPETLFGTKFESYLNQPEKQITLKDINIDDIGGMYE